MNTILTRAVSSTLILTVGALSGVCHAGVVVWEEADGGNGNAYEIVQALVSWDDANALAMASSFNGVQGHLATITSAEENGFIASLMTNEHFAWLGGFQSDPGSPSADGWEWVTGETWDFTNWKPGEPNDAGGTPESYVGMWGPNGQSGAFSQWNDFIGGLHPGPGPNAYVIEYEVPAPFAGVILLGAFVNSRRRRRA